MMQVVFGHISLQLAESQPDEPSTAGCVAHARKVVSQALACRPHSHRAEKALLCWLLARLELLGNVRRKHERAEAHAMQVTIMRCLAHVVTIHAVTSSCSD